jgi:hypothetical protein
MLTASSRNNNNNKIINIIITDKRPLFQQQASLEDAHYVIKK